MREGRPACRSRGAPRLACTRIARQPHMPSRTCLAAHAPSRGRTPHACCCHRWSASHARRSRTRWMRTGSDTIGEVARRPRELQQEMTDERRHTILSAGERDIVVATLHRCASLSLCSTCTVCTISRSLIDRDTVTAHDRSSCLISHCLRQVFTAPRRVGGEALKTGHIAS